MSMYMLLLYDDPKAWAKISPDEMQKAIEKYRAWRAKPFTKDSNRLGDDAGRVIRSTNGKGRRRRTVQRDVGARTAAGGPRPCGRSGDEL